MKVIRQKGDAYEFIVRTFLHSAPVYRSKLKQVWLLNEVPIKKEELSKIKIKIAETDTLINENSNIDNEFYEFAAYALDYTECLRNRWWDLHGEKLNEYKYLVFRNKIIIQPNGNVYTPNLSYIYSLENENDDPKVVKNHNMVELPDTASGSVGLLVRILQA